MRFPAILAAMVALTVVLGMVAPAAVAADDPQLLAAGRALCDQFEQGDTAPIAARMTPALREALGGPAGVAEMRERMLREDGPESGVIVEETRTAGPARIYRRIARRNVGQTPTLMEWTLDAQDRIVDLVIRPQPVAIPSGKSNY